ncbi:chemotaxis protein CheY [Pseudomonas chlororaphis]|jgi:hypothetical protein|uniref:Response regulator n=1 Tax=Pseudomonas morbosilactucae TaxID=2938197 RepID=A0ABT0JGX7_9PSED|nr:response regulator [Pseudomonas morbosilactucae]MCK9815165.1 response regulator [Pseudomonas morbosilactucae]ROL69799.1 chemotaxis protein CheY [Pseudomonas chlororaphis]WEK07352.1 MAG: response regulator [Pseudomonas sp.]
MPNKTLRILIADAQHFYRLKIERVLNHLGYYRVAPMHRLEEVLNVVEYGCEPLDLLIINASLANDPRLDLPSFCMQNPQIRHALIYNQDPTDCESLPSRRSPRVQLSGQALPDPETLSALMAALDPGEASTWQGLKWG